MVTSIVRCPYPDVHRCVVRRGFDILASHWPYHRDVLHKLHGFCAVIVPGASDGLVIVPGATIFYLDSGGSGVPGVFLRLHRQLPGVAIG